MAAALLLLLLAAAPALAQEQPKVGIEERLGEVLPLAELTFNDEDGQPIVLADLVDRPVVLTLVYYHCPSICTPLLQETARIADLTDLRPGDDYRIVTVSFDPGETPELARTRKAALIASMERHQVAPEDWRFLTGDEANIRRLTSAVGFHYIRDQNQVDYVHAATILFLSPAGKIVRYLNGTRFNPADLKMAVLDASEGRARSFMQKMQRLCYGYDPEGRVYLLKLNRIILGVTIVFVLGFGGFLWGTRGSGRPVRRLEGGT